MSGHEPPARRAIGEPEHHRPRWLVAAVLGLSAVLIVALGVVLSHLTSDGGSDASRPLALPARFGEYTRDPGRGGTPSVHPDSAVETVSATYTRDGEAELVVLATRPQDNAQNALKDVEASNIRTIGTGACGRTPEQQDEACVVIEKDIAVMVVTLSDHTSDELLVAARQVAKAIASGG